MTYQQTRVLSLLFSVTGMLILLSLELRVPAQAIGAVTTDVASVAFLDASQPIVAPAASASVETLTFPSWRSAGRGLPSGRVGGAGR